MKTTLAACVTLVVLLCVGPVMAADIYVDASAPGDDDGSDWANAYTDLQDALAVDVSGDIIHVAAGTYIPGTSAGDTFQITSGVTLYGGYPPGGDGDRNPDPATNGTVLSGYQEGALLGTDHVVTTSGTNNTTVLDGFTISGGGPAYHQAGVGVYGGSPTLTNVIISNNTSYGGGGAGMYAQSPTLINVEFSNNCTVEEAGHGGGLYVTGNATLTNVVFSNNTNETAGHGGGLYVTGHATLTDVTFSGNEGGMAGGGMLVESGGSADLTNVTFAGNSAYGAGGGMGVYGSATLTNVTFSDNSTDPYEACSGGGMCVGYNSYATLENVTFAGNSTGGQGGGMVIYGTGTTLTNVTFADNSASAAGGGMGVYGSATLTNVTFSGNSASDGCGILVSSDLREASAEIRNTILWGSTSPITNDGGSITISDSVVKGGYTGGINIITDDPMLGTLGDYGGYTQTIPLLEGSSAIDAANATYAPDTDQRGVSRPLDGDGDGTAGYDIGACEVEGGGSGGNTPPEIGTIITNPIEPMSVGTEILAGAPFTDENPSTCSGTWDWGDGSTSDGSLGVMTVDEQEYPAIEGNHIYSTAGVYTVTLTVTDASDESDEAICDEYVVVYDPSAGFVTGGGWIDSPGGAYALDTSLTGKATFGFVSKYKKGATVPTGNTEFQFKAGVLNFHSTSYDWLVVTGSDHARFKGLGEINGSGDYRFMLWAGDGASDTFRIRIWTEDEAGNETIVYDNGTDQAISGGNIVIHAK